jgi:heme-degrading monooxygenase HmoA
MPFIPFLTLLSIMLATLSGCTYTAPYRAMPTASVPEAGATALVTLTAAEIRPGKRRAFFRQTRKVLEDLPQHEGLLGYSFRFQIFGRKAWTITSWRDATARNQFLSSKSHREAAREGAQLASKMSFRTLEVPRESLPLGWGEALKELDSALRHPGNADPASTIEPGPTIPPR